jgi:hypothetical protein
MATLELGPLADHLEADQIKALRRALSEAGAPPLAADDHADPVVIEGNLDEDVFTDFTDRLDANDAAADVYLPIDFEDVVEVDGLRVGSVHALILVLDSLKEDFFVEEEEDEEDAEEAEYEDEDEDDENGASLFGEDEEEIEVKDERLRLIWRIMHKSAKTAVRKNVCLFVRT